MGYRSVYPTDCALGQGANAGTSTEPLGHDQVEGNVELIVLFCFLIDS